MSEDETMMLQEVGYLLGSIRRVCEESAVIRTKYRYLEKEVGTEKNDPVLEKNRAILKKILGELEVLQDVNVLSRVRIKRQIAQLDQ